MTRNPKLNSGIPEPKGPRNPSHSAGSSHASGVPRIPHPPRVAEEHPVCPRLTPWAVWEALKAKPLCLLWPFGYMIDAVRNFRNPHSKAIFWLFCIFFGFVFIYADPTAEGGADSARYAARFSEMHAAQDSFASLSSQFYKPGSGYLDIYDGLATWFISRFTGEPCWLFMFFAAIFGFFYCQNLWLVFENMGPDRRIGFTWWSFILLFVVTMPIWYVNGVRMFTAAHVYSYGVLVFIMKRDWRGLVWASLSILIHFSFMMPVAILAIFLLVPKNLTALVILFLISAFVDLLDLDQIREALSFMPDAYQDKIQSHTGEVYALAYGKRGLGQSSHVGVAAISRRLIMYFAGLVPYLFRNTWINHRPFLKNLFAFALLFSSFALVVEHVPSGGRMLTIANFFLLTCLVIMMSERRFAQRSRLWNWLCAPVVLFVFIFKLRVGMDYYGFMTIAGNPFFALVVRDTIPLIDIIKWLLGV